jgi:hypothetical protein
MDSDDSWTRALLGRALGESPILADPAAHRLQVLVGEIDATGAQPCITWHPYRLGAEYIYPASAIKPIAAVAALSAFRGRKAEDPALEQVGLHTLLRVVGQSPEKQVEGEPPPPPLTVAGQIGAALSVSSNPAYNFTVDLAGYNDLHQLMWARGLKSVRLRHRLSLFGLTEKDQRTTSQITALLPEGEVELVQRRESKMRVPLHGHPGAGVGQHHRVRGSRVPIAGPMDFSEKNAVALTDLARLTAWVADPALVPELSFPLLQPEDRELIKASMSHLPEDWPRWMPLRTGLIEVLPAEDLVYVHKSGMAYGFYLDIGHVQQRSTGRAFVLAVASHLNPNGVVNDGRYAYEELGHPMMQALGKQLGRELLLGEQP